VPKATRTLLMNVSTSQGIRIQRKHKSFLNIILAVLSKHLFSKQMQRTWNSLILSSVSLNTMIFIEYHVSNSVASNTYGLRSGNVASASVINCPFEWPTTGPPSSTCAFSLNKIILVIGLRALHE
jgi:hypothetical protein